VRFWAAGAWGATLDLDFKAVDVAAVPQRPGAFAVLGMEGEILWIDDALGEQPKTRRDLIGGGKLAARTALAPFGGGLAATGMGREVHWSSGGPWNGLGSGVGDEKGKLVGFEALQATGATTLYAAGWRGELWCLEGTTWTQTDSPTNVILTGLASVGGGDVIACGRQGMLLRGNRERWTVLEHSVAEDFWSVVRFRDVVYVSSLSSIYELGEDGPSRVDDGSPTGSYCRLAANDSLLISVGAAAILAYDGTDWTELA